MDYNNKPDGYYNNVRQEMLAYLPKNAKTVLDVGCGNGAFAARIKTKNTAEVWGIEYMDEEAKQAEQVLDTVFSGPCEAFIKDLPDNFFYVIYFNDVLEHLVDPYDVFDQIKHKLRATGVVISSIPNMRYYNAFIKLLVKKD
jgi:2-polyprenyl-3-methyl-5-hydroxy-6-metoxy-1,4-benzoquinol methylase